MNTRMLWGVVLVLTVIIIVLTFVLFFAPSPPHEGGATTTPVVIPETPATSTSEKPLHTRVEVDSPKPNEKVGKTFSVSGKAPGPWFFEATFPIQVRDKDDAVIGRSHANAQGDWMTEGQVKFTATVNINGDYSGPATLVLLRDNPSGLPENDDALEIPIVIR